MSQNVEIVREVMALVRRTGTGEPEPRLFELESNRVFLERGREWFDAYAAATHCEIPLKTLSTRDWKRWRNTALKIVKQLEKNQAKVGNWILAEGLTPIEGAEKLATMSPDETAALLRRLGVPSE